MTHPLLFPGIAFQMNGNEDAYFVEGSEIAQYDFATKSYEITGDVGRRQRRVRPVPVDRRGGLRRGLITA